MVIGKIVMMKQLIQIANIFAQVAIEEDTILSRITQKGIFFFMPELAWKGCNVKCAANIRRKTG